MAIDVRLAQRNGDIVIVDKQVLSGRVLRHPFRADGYDSRRKLCTVKQLKQRVLTQS